MFVEAQETLVSKLDSAREDDAGTDPAQRLVPKAVRPYGGEALKPKQLIRDTPILFVEFDVSGVQSMNTEVSGGGITLDVICAARNQATREAEYSDGLALITWTFEQLLGMRIQVGGYGDLEWAQCDVGRMLSGEKLWVAKVSPDWTLNAYG